MVVSTTPSKRRKVHCDAIDRKHGYGVYVSNERGYSLLFRSGETMQIDGRKNLNAAINSYREVIEAVVYFFGQSCVELRIVQNKGVVECERIYAEASITDFRALADLIVAGKGDSNVPFVSKKMVKRGTVFAAAEAVADELLKQKVSLPYLSYRLDHDGVQGLLRAWSNDKNQIVIILPGSRVMTADQAIDLAGENLKTGDLISAITSTHIVSVEKDSEGTLSKLRIKRLGRR
ncbi:MAG: hypothetical protein NTW50_00605 [Candidatus Berkelbacteria bacterium]|nr:hypothetical protein [Candidatus Berkelbacteria bacterium]